LYCSSYKLGWEGLNLEEQAVSEELWEAEKRGEDLELLNPRLKQRRDNPIWPVIQRELRRPR
jgi:hypothetical protein